MVRYRTQVQDTIHRYYRLPSLVEMEFYCSLLITGLDPGTFIKLLLSKPATAVGGKRLNLKEWALAVYGMKLLPE